jgi:transglutaminase-like putative cysteine protease
VTVTDNLDSNILLDVDSSKVDLSTPGEYEVVYSATDFFGNTTSVTAKVTVYQNQDSYVELDVIYAEVDALLAKIITDDMNTRQQVQAIYKWVRNNCRYISHSEKDNWIQAGYRMLQDRKGDCYNYFGITKLMLERLEIPSIDVVKVPNYEGDSNHFWSLVSVDGGETYYHVDTTPRTVPTNFCLVTDKVMDDFSAGYRNCFNRDKSLYPATPLE